MNEQLKSKLISMRTKDLEMRNSILKKESLYDGYPEEMEALHIQNAKKLKTIIDENGWPEKSLVGKEAADAAFTITQHAISSPDLQRHFLVELKKAVSKGEATQVQEACLEDRILFNQGKPCLYGMLFDWDEPGNLVANVDDETLVNERRKKIGLQPLSEAIERHRQEIENEGCGPPSNIAEHKRIEKEWAKRAGWR